MNSRQQRRRNLNVLRVALHRMVSYEGAFPLADIGCRIDGMLLAHETPEGLDALVTRLAELGHLMAVGEAYQVRQGSELFLTLLGAHNKDSARALEELVEPVPLGQYERLLGPDVFGDEPTGGERAAALMSTGVDNAAADVENAP